MNEDYPNLVQHNIENSLEDLILTGMIISKEFMEGVSHVINPEFFLSPHIKQVADWVLRYYQEQNDVPKESIQEIFITECKYSTVPDPVADRCISPSSPNACDGISLDWSVTKR